MNHRVKKSLGQNILRTHKFWLEKNWPKKCSWSTKILCKKIFWVQKNVWFRNILGQKKGSHPNKICQKNVYNPLELRVQENPVKRNFWSKNYLLFFDNSYKD